MRILRIKNAKLSRYCFYTNTNIYGDFQICISVPLSCNANNLNLTENFNTFPLVQAHSLKNPKNVIIGYLNVNFLRNNFKAVEKLIKGKIDAFLISETKTDE